MCYSNFAQSISAVSPDVFCTINTLDMFTRLKCERLYNEAVFKGGYEEISQNQRLNHIMTDIIYLDNLSAYIYAQGVTYIDLMSQDYPQSEW